MLKNAAAQIEKIGKKTAIYERHPAMHAQPLVILMEVSKIKSSVFCKVTSHR